VLANHLEAPTRRIFLARTAQEAESILANHAVSLVLLDLLLPDSDGRNFLVELRRRPEMDGVPVIINSADTSAATRAECYTLGADEFFHKPISPAVLSAAVTSKLQRAREIFLQSRTDRLTGLGNRTAVIEAFRRLGFLVDRGGSSLSLAILDLDRFKRVNDAFGHAIGDGVLKFLAQVLTRHLRDSDVIGRWGGEEFVVLFPGAEHWSAAAALEKTLDIFRAHRFDAPAGASFSVSFSGGVVEIQPGDGLEQAIERADALMYRAKAAGRNRILAAPAGEEPESPRLLLVLRDPVLGSSIQYRLQEEGFDALLKTDAASALEAAPGFPANLLLLEMGLSDMTGLDLLTRLKRLPAYHKLPVLMLADPEHEQAMERGLAAGVSDFALLPLSQVELITRIRRLIKRLRLPSAAIA
jgi:diguanylate cyclase (GGDEF)-like protein